MRGVTRILNIQDLREACDRLLTGAEAKFGPDIDLDSHRQPLAEYWSFDPKTAYAMSEDPRSEAGSITEDLEGVRDLLQRPDGEVFLWHDLNNLCGLLRMLAFMDTPSG